MMIKTSKKGFTLVEILAVIVIISVVMLIGGVAISQIRLNINADMLKKQLEIVLTNAKTFGTDYESEIDTQKEIKLDELISSGYYTSNDLIEKQNILQEIAQRKKLKEQIIVVL